MAGVFSPGVNTDVEALTNDRVNAMIDALQGLTSESQQSGLGPGVEKALEQLITVTNHSVALHVKVNDLEGKTKGMADTVEAKLIELKTSEERVKGVVTALTDEVTQAISGIGEQFKMRDDQSFMNVSGVKLQADTTASRLTHVESIADHE